MFLDPISVKGNILDYESKEPIHSAVVYVKGTTIGTTTDSFGNFMIPVNSNFKGTLVVNYVGYCQLEIVIPELNECSLELDSILIIRNYNRTLIVEGKVAKRKFPFNIFQRKQYRIDDIPSDTTKWNFLIKHSLPNYFYSLKEQFYPLELKGEEIFELDLRDPILDE
jgi:hypothetical protein